MILYGHHEPVVGAELIRTEVTAIRDAILHVHDATVQGMNEGRDLYELMQTITLPTECEVGQGYGKVSWSVRAIWENYAGWFKHRSTTELYSVPQQSIYADLIELAGANAVVDRAQQKLARGNLEEAQHLLDIVLEVEPGHDGAIAMAIDVHQQLLAQSQNFWLSGWLENQIKLLRGGSTAALSFK
jgi:alkyl sulfatase BDS1-like metallo-beta-lactamase superfamily hydrolase